MFVINSLDTEKVYNVIQESIQVKNRLNVMFVLNNLHKVDICKDIQEFILVKNHVNLKFAINSLDKEEVYSITQASILVEKPFEREICSKRFSVRHSLQRHSKIHVEE